MTLLMADWLAKQVEKTCSSCVYARQCVDLKKQTTTWSCKLHKATKNHSTFTCNDWDVVERPGVVRACKGE